MSTLDHASAHERLLLFDGVCNLCTGVVRFIIKHDKRGLFHFASLQSGTGEAVLTAHSMPTDAYASFVYVRKGRVLVKSTAALNIARDLGGLWSLGYGFIIVPPFLRDAVYGFVARNRYNWFGRKDECMLPTPELKGRFVG
ncbi:MAG: thiol-disulfide oxidoreductase DCC family protein [Flavobacteriales bacterium]|nr:thiol-disulfide oxidoreductase DCC family protein [Flavobacteriales bacterium]